MIDAPAIEHGGLFSRIGAIVSSAALLLAAGPAGAQPVLYVDDDAPPGGDGLSWATAFYTIRQATPDLPGLPGRVVRVAQGIYNPRDAQSPSADDAVMLLSGMTLLGGYRGLSTGGSPDDRDPHAFVTIIDGDAGTAPGWDDNSYVCVRAVQCPEAVIDGFVIRNARNRHVMAGDTGQLTIRDCEFASDPDRTIQGSLHLVTSSGAVLERCRFHGIRFAGSLVYAGSDGDVAVHECEFTDNASEPFSPTVEYVLQAWDCGSVLIESCVFTGNTAQDQLIALSYCDDATITRTRIESNGAPWPDGIGGLIHIKYVPGLAIVEDCLLRDNHVMAGTGIGIEMGRDGDRAIRRCQIVRNDFNHYAILGQPLSPSFVIEISLIADNDVYLGRVIHSGSPLRVVGSTVAHNRVANPDGTGISASLSAMATVERSIVWANRAGTAEPSLATQLRLATVLSVSDSVITGAEAIPGSLALDPMFVDLEDFRLRPDSPAINLGLNPASDPLNGAIDLAGNPRVAHGFVDAGCYELQGLPAACGPADLATTAVRGLPGYRIPDSVVNSDDFFAFLEAYTLGDAAADLTTTAIPGSPGYLIPNGLITPDDFFVYLGLFESGC